MAMKANTWILVVITVRQWSLSISGILAYLSAAKIRHLIGLFMVKFQFRSPAIPFCSTFAFLLFLQERIMYNHWHAIKYKQ